MIGRVRDRTAQGIPGVDVSITSTDGTVFLTDSTDSDGRFAFGQLPAKSYYLFTESLPIGFDDLLLEWFDNVIMVDDVAASSGATLINLGIGAVFNTADFELEPGTEIDGIVRDNNGGGLAGVEMNLYRSDGSLFRTTMSEFDGSYRFEKLPYDSYYVRTRLGSSPFLDQWYNGALLFSDNPLADNATEIVADNAGPFSNIDFDFSLGGTITGRVTAAVVGGVSNVQVEAYDVFGRFQGSGATDETGAYQIVGLSPGLVGVRTVAPAPYANEWWDDVAAFTFLPNVDNPLGIVVGDTNQPVPSVDFVLEQSGSISGSVQDAQGTPLVDIPLEVYGTNGAFRVSVLSSTNGSFQIDGLKPGNYYLRSGSYDGFGFFDEWFGDVAVTAAGPTADGATIIPVPVGSVISGTDLTLVSGADQIALEVIDAATSQLRLSWNGLPGYAYRLKGTNDLESRYRVARGWRRTGGERRK